MAISALAGFAEIDARASPFDLETMALIVGLFVAIVVGVNVALRFRKQARTGESGPEAEQSLAHYRDLLDRGLLDPREFERIAESLRRPPTPPANS